MAVCIDSGRVTREMSFPTHSKTPMNQAAGKTLTGNDVQFMSVEFCRSPGSSAA